MSEKLASLVVDLQLESVALREGLDKAKGDLRRFADSSKQSSREAGDGFTVLKGVMVNLATEGLRMVKDAMVECVAAFAEASKVEAQLEWATGENAAAFKAQAAVMRETLGVDDGMVMRLQMLAARMDVNHSQIERLTRATLDYAAATGDDAEGAVQKLLRGIENGGDGLKKMGIEYKSTGDSAKDLDLALAQLERRWGGAAKASADSFAGSLDKMKQELGELAESFGGLFAAISEKTGIIRTLTDALAGARMALEQGFDSDATPQAKRTEELIALQEKRIALNEKLEHAEKRVELQRNATHEFEKRAYDESFREMMTYSNQLFELDKQIAAQRKKMGIESGVPVGGDGKGHKVGKKTGDAKKFEMVPDDEAFKKFWVEQLREEERFAQWRRDNDQWLFDAEVADIHRLGEERRKAFLVKVGLMDDGRMGGMAWSAGAGAAPKADVGVVEKVSGHLARLTSDFSADARAFSGSFRGLGSAIVSGVLGTAGQFAAGFKDTMAGAGNIILSAAMSAAPKFGAMMQGAMQGLQSGGVWGALIGAIAALLTKTKSFALIMEQVEQGMGWLVDILEPMLKPMLALNIVFNSLLSSLTKVLGPMLNTVGKVLFDIFKFLGIAVLDIVIMLKDFWNGVVIGISQIFYQIGDFFKSVGLDFMRDTMYGIAAGAMKWQATSAGAAQTRRELVGKEWDNLIPATKEETKAKEDNAEATRDATEKTRRFTETLTNVPSGWRVNDARYASQKTSDKDLPNIDVQVFVGDQALAGSIQKIVTKNNFRKLGSPV